MIIDALFGNDLDGVDADKTQTARDWRPELTGWKRRILWWVRNPFHNLFWHVLGVTDRQTQQLSAGWEQHSNTGERGNWRHDGTGWYIRVTKKGWIVLPFVSYWTIGLDFYAGWRERGNLGFALRRNAR